jgi:hypothetical protein
MESEHNSRSNLFVWTVIYPSVADCKIKGQVFSRLSRQQSDYPV